MNKNIIYITDSSILKMSQDLSIYSIISLNGSVETIERIALRSYEIFKGTILSEKSFNEWYQLDENSNMLFDFLDNLYNERSKCLFTTYLSDHNYSKFLLYIHSFLSMNDNTIKEAIMKKVDVLYKDLDISLLQSFNDNINKDELIKLNTHFMMLLKSTFPNKFLTNIQSITNSLEKQIEYIVRVNKVLCTDLSIVDYLHYSASLINLTNEYTINTICASEHSVKNTNFFINNTAILPNNTQFEYQVITDFKENYIGVLLRNLLIISNFIWNQLHISNSIDKISDKDKLIMIYLWLLFQSKYSNWIIANADFAKIKQILEEIQEQDN